MSTYVGVQHGARVGAPMSFNARIPLSVFRVPDGKIAITFTLHGTKGATAVIEVAGLDRWRSSFEAGTGITAAYRANCPTHAQIRELLPQDLERHDDADMDSRVATGFWLASNHPDASTTRRTQVAASVRTHNRAQVTIASDHRRREALPCRIAFSCRKQSWRWCRPGRRCA